MYHNSSAYSENLNPGRYSEVCVVYSPSNKDIFLHSTKKFSDLALFPCPLHAK